MKIIKWSLVSLAHRRRVNIGRLGQGPDTPDAIRQRHAIFRFSLTDNIDPSLSFPSVITFYYLVYIYLLKFALIGCFIY